MKYLGTIVLLMCLMEPIRSQVYKSPAEEVNPYIGTAHCRWFHFTPGAVPFGMAKPGPSTNGSLGNKYGWEAVGYDYRDSTIEGFPNFHEFQVGGIVFMPTTGKLITIPGKPDQSNIGYRSRFDRQNEEARPGYYAVLLKDYNIKAELTATKRVAIHRYTFPKGESSYILFDIGNRQGESGVVKNAKVYLSNDGRVEGFVETLPEYVHKYQRGGSVKMFFSAVLDKMPMEVGTFRKENIHHGARVIEGPGSGMFLKFTTTSEEQITIKAGLSYTSIENARANLQEEAATINFEEAKLAASKSWNELLGKISIEGGKPNDREKFYTGLYHALLGRGLASDVNGAYPKNDGNIGTIPMGVDNKPIHNHYNTDAVWGAFWNLTPLWALVYPSYYSDFIKSQLLVYKDAGWLGDGIANSRYVSGVGTNFVSLIMAGAYMYGIRDFDIQLAYEAARKNELEWKNRPLGAGKEDVEQFVKNGFVGFENPPSGEANFAGSHTLEYSFSSFAVGQWARALNKKRDYVLLNNLSKGWEKLFDSNTGFIRPKYKGGSFIENFNPTQPWRGFQEGNAWQYTFYVPHTPKALIKKVGRDEFNHRLDSIFNIAQSVIFGGGKTIDAFAGLQSLYNHGNQPCLHIPWLFNYSGKPWLTQKWVRSICNEFYGNGGVHGYGYGQDEDQGQLGAWFVMAAIGLFDVQGGGMLKPEMQLSSPLFPKIRITLDTNYYNGKSLVVNSNHSNPQNIYIQTASFNGKRIMQPSIRFEQLTNGGVIEYSLGSTPSRLWK